MSPENKPSITGKTTLASDLKPPSWMQPVQPSVPDHELVRRIGGGSYGDVWLARSTVGTWRAVKVVFRDRFLDARPYERELNGIQKFEPLSRLNEGFIDILQIGRNDSDGYFYYVMELADDVATAAKSDPSLANSNQSVGHPLNTDHRLLTTVQDPASYVPKTLSKVLLQQGRLPVSECLELGLTLNLGLAHLHKAGLIHRDIKPSNIIYVGGVPKLADIGLVAEVAEARSYVGTEGFIPPEGPNSPQADLYSLGKVLYEAGMGKDRKEFPEPFTQIAEAPDSSQLLEFNAILLKACAANRAERYRSAEEMNADLALLQSGGSVRRQRKLAGQLRFVQRAGALVTALAAVIALGWWWQARQTERMRKLAEENGRLATQNARLLEFERVQMRQAGELKNEDSAIIIMAGPITNRLNGHHYYFLENSDIPLAQSFARALGGNLATIRSEAEQRWVFDMFGKWKGIPRHLGIGLYDPDPENNSTNRDERRREFGWISGEPVTFSNWADFEPNSYEGAREPYVHMWAPGQMAKGGTWNDTDGNGILLGVGVHGVVEVIPSNSSSPSPKSRASTSSPSTP